MRGKPAGRGPVCGSNGGRRGSAGAVATSVPFLFPGAGAWGAVPLFFPAAGSLPPPALVPGWFHFPLPLNSEFCFCLGDSLPRPTFVWRHLCCSREGHGFQGSKTDDGVRASTLRSSSEGPTHFLTHLAPSPSGSTSLSCSREQSARLECGPWGDAP